jgi:hypothetical protein
MEPPTKFVPATATERVAGLVRLPATAELGVSPEIVGLVTVKVLALEVAVAPPFWTVTLPDPEVASWVLVTYAVSEDGVL